MMKPRSILLVLVVAGAAAAMLLWSRSGPPRAGSSKTEPDQPREADAGAGSTVVTQPAVGSAVAIETPEALAKQITLLEGQVEYLQGQVKALQEENAELLERLGTLGMKHVTGGAGDKPSTPSLTEGESAMDYVSLGIDLISLRKVQHVPVPTVPAPQPEVEKLILGWLKKQFPGDQAQRRSRALAALGAIPQAVEILPLQAALMVRQLGGWYDFEKETLFVVEPEPGSAQPQPDPVMALAYGELLRDYGGKLLPEGIHLSTDARTAREALLGGDAALMRFLYSLKKPIPVNPNDLPPEDPDHPFNQVPLPIFLRELQLFPFSRGFEFAQSLHSVGDFKQLSAAYGRPPASCAEVIDPELYLAQNPPAAMSIDWPDAALAGALPYWDDKLGRFAAFVILKAYNPEEIAFDATKGWRADRHGAWAAEGVQRDHTVWQTAWAGPSDARLFFKAMREVLLQRYDQPLDPGAEATGLEFAAQGRFIRLSINRQGTGVLLIDAATNDFAASARERFDAPSR